MDDPRNSLETLKKSISEMTTEELLARCKQVRQQRRSGEATNRNKSKPRNISPEGEAIAAQTRVKKTALAKQLEAIRRLSQEEQAEALEKALREALGE